MSGFDPVSVISQFEKEWGLISGAPFSFAICAVVVGGFGYLLARWYSKRTIEALTSENSSLKERIESLKGQLPKTCAQPTMPSSSEIISEGNSEIFKSLDINPLKLHARRWLTKYPEALIQKIVLYRSSHLNHQGYLGPISAKYFVAFAVPEGSDSTRLATATQYYQTAGIDYLDLMASDFNEVYKSPPTGDGFKKEWEFYVLRQQEAFPLQVMKDEPSIELYP